MCMTNICLIGTPFTAIAAALHCLLLAALIALGLLDLTRLYT